MSNILARAWRAARRSDHAHTQHESLAAADRAATDPPATGDLDEDDSGAGNDVLAASQTVGGAPDGNRSPLSALDQARLEHQSAQRRLDDANAALDHLAATRTVHAGTDQIVLDVDGEVEALLNPMLDASQVVREREDDLRELLTERDTAHESALAHNQFYDEHGDPGEMREDADIAADAGSAAANADHAAAYGWLHAGHEQALEEQAAARDVLPGLSPAVTEKVTAWQEHKGRDITLAEVRWLQHLTDQHETDQHEPDQHETDQHGTDQHGTDQHETDQHETDQHGTDQFEPGFVFYGNWTQDTATRAEHLARLDALTQYLAQVPEPPTADATDVTATTDVDGL